MKFIDNIGKIIWKCLAILPLFFIIANYFTVLKPEQRDGALGIIFLAISVAYFATALTFIIKNWNG